MQELKLCYLEKVFNMKYKKGCNIRIVRQGGATTSEEVIGWIFMIAPIPKYVSRIFVGQFQTL